MQIVGYRVDPGDSALLIANGERVERISLAAGTELAYPLGERHCAGIVEDETHYSCERTRAPFCEQHTDDRAPSYTDEEYAIYLAAFAPATFKVGITRSWRLETRLREQGADRAAHVHTVSSGRIARAREREIANQVPEAVRVRRKIEGLAASVDCEAWEELLERYPPIETYDFEYGTELGGQPIAETLATGTVIGTKGRILVLDWAESTYATDLRELVGYEISAAGRAHQASLGAF